MHAFLIVGQSKQERGGNIEKMLASRHVKDSPLNQYILDPSALIDKSTYGIEEIRSLISWTQESHAEPSAAIIKEAERLTKPAQHALLKTLEEGAKQLIIILSAESEQSLLPTIRSRCRIVRVVGKTEQISPEDSQKIMRWMGNVSKKDPATRVLMLYQALSKIAGKTVSPRVGSIQRQDGLQFVKKIIDALHVILKGPTLPPARSDLHTHQWIAKTLKLAITAHRLLSQNLNVALVLQQFILELDSSQTPC